MKKSDSKKKKPKQYEQTNPNHSHIPEVFLQDLEVTVTFLFSGLRKTYLKNMGEWYRTFRVEAYTVAVPQSSSTVTELQTT